MGINSKSSKQNKSSKPIHPWNPDPMAAVRYHKLPFYAKNLTPGDGNCFYHAVADQIVNNPNVYETISPEAKQCLRHDQLRKQSIIFIKSSPLVTENENFIAERVAKIFDLRERHTAKYPNRLSDDQVWDKYLLTACKSGVYA